MAGDFYYGSRIDPQKGCDSGRPVGLTFSRRRRGEVEGCADGNQPQRPQMEPIDRSCRLSNLSSDPADLSRPPC
ncbi:Hypp861 [Branchiostoma lanceolatum]|uniref:Hypp861 protein n=1 Tax=Branchiostoma lanceolatum TaxID=7740 RepID=A0A8J9VC75_BRALA|nr:Hypp861 [Branchiostoma lanceolatum]